ncbi:hypothetical protein HD806DRAFT_540347 [Xylariaceae sp. AK1471]|nr:hypothetical protein HD806DRAFT_540347 [Xylariaceae sp. AK1471]
MTAVTLSASMILTGAMSPGVAKEESALEMPMTVKPDRRQRDLGKMVLPASADWSFKENSAPSKPFIATSKGKQSELTTPDDADLDYSDCEDSFLGGGSIVAQKVHYCNYHGLCGSSKLLEAKYLVQLAKKQNNGTAKKEDEVKDEEDDGDDHLLFNDPYGLLEGFSPSAFNLSREPPLTRGAMTMTMPAMAVLVSHVIV